MEEQDKLFSDKIANFQTLDMIQKIKKIKKKRKTNENNKKIDFPEILTNVPKEEENENLIEGFQRFKFTDNDYDGKDNILDDVGKLATKDPRQYIVDLINYIYNTTVAYNKKIAHSMTVSLSGGDSKDSDEKIVYNHLCIFEAIIFSGLVVNNWYYLMYYNNFTEGEKKDLFDFKTNTIKCLDDSTFLNRFLKHILLYFIEYALFFPEKLEYLLIKLIPNFTSTLFNHTLCYIFLFFTILYLSYNFASGFKNFLIDTIMLNTKNIVVVFMYITVVILYIIPEGKNCETSDETNSRSENSENNNASDMNNQYNKMAEDLKQMGTPDNEIQQTLKNVYEKPVNNTFIGNLKQKASNFKDRIKNKFMGKNNSGSSNNTASSSITGQAATTVFNIIWNVIRFLIIISITVPLGGFFCLVYFVFYSIYAMLFYNSWDAIVVAETFKEMMKFLDGAKIDLIKNKKENPSFYEMLIIKFNEYIEFISDNFFILVIMFTFIFITKDTLKNIVNITMKNTLFYLDISFIFMILMALLIIIKSKFNITDVAGAMNLITSTVPVEKNYNSSRDIFFFVNLLIYGLSLGGLGYFFMLFINFNKTK